MAIPVIIDTDPGIDDALALMLAIASPELDLRAVTTVGGNTGLAHTTENALRLLHLLGRDDVPVAAGADVPLVRRDSAPDPSTHGEDGFGGVRLDPAPRGADPRSAVQVMVDVIEGSAEPVTLIALGPLTNVAVLVAAFPDVAARLERIVLMGGGARVIGNMTPAAEFNIWYDPEAAARVFAAGVPVTMVGLDVTHQALTAPEDWDGLRGGGPVAEAVLAMVEFYTAYYLAVAGTASTAQHDSLAVAAVLQPGLVTTRSLHVDVECAGALTRGMTVVDVDDVAKAAPNADVALAVDADAFNRLLVSRVTALDARLR
ncbi:nucleoside hydrolase [Cellulomonas chengniuliangii]|uniref:Nucleoside hydrolase n=1 Tax=Cellulomonas chengniuliangii TaxID=2968084 RepID=A0ABY5KY46_9CELL|nr:nucleoside hydrolase [Cellulomonas chengniuliangii]MCC2307803.1 nucleoside hydrolase [Cellulomonas chengniuliangii]UUI75440.1 nucleoside hydrolase [Cellulomonas chengniuliangii]